MPLGGFTTIDGDRIPLDKIDEVRDAGRLNCSPATLAHLLRLAHDRDDVPDGISASQVGKEARQLFLEESTDYYPTTDMMMAGYSGTMKHEQVNVSHSRMIVEQRLTSKRNPLFTAKLDHAAIIDLNLEGPERVLLVDLFDLKTAKWYALTLAAKDVWKNQSDYAWQVNLQAVLLEELTKEEIFDLTRLDADRIVVRNLYLEWLPADASYKNAAEAERLGLHDFRKALVPVPRKDSAEVYAKYEAKLEEKHEARRANWAPVCPKESRWKDNCRCNFYCLVREECIALSAAVGEPHPLVEDDDTLSEKLQRSVEAKR